MTIPSGSESPAMRSVFITQPRTLMCGLDAHRECLAYIRNYGSRRVLLVTGGHTAVFADRVADLLRPNVDSIEVYPGVMQEPTIAAFDAALSAARAFAPDTVVGIGGGSSLDIAKLVAGFMSESRPIADCFGINLLTQRKIHLVCIPTTAGTGSEVSPNAIVLDEKAHLKRAVISPWLVPDATFIDPGFMVSMPALVTAGTGMDALTHCIEAYANRYAHPAVDVYALGGIRLISQNLLTAIRSPHDLTARANMALGSLFGGLCLGPVNTAAVHALSYPLGGRYHVPHGISNTLLLPHVLRFNFPADPVRYAEIACALGVPEGVDRLETAQRGIAWLQNTADEANIPMRLRDWNIPQEAIADMAVSAMEVTRLLRNNPREVTLRDAVEIYEDAY